MDNDGKAIETTKFGAKKKENGNKWNVVRIRKMQGRTRGSKHGKKRKKTKKKKKKQKKKTERTRILIMEKRQQE